MQSSATMDRPIGLTTQEFARLDKDGFRHKLEDYWLVAEAVGHTVADKVEDGKIVPVQGAAIVAATIGQLFGVQEFHRELRPADLAVQFANGGQQEGLQVRT